MCGCNCIASFAIPIRCYLSSSVCLWRECIVTKRLQLGSCSFHQNVAQCLISLPAMFDEKIRREPLDLWIKVGWGGFRLRDAVSRKRFEIELRWQLITNRKVIYGLSIATKVDDLEWPWSRAQLSAIVSFLTSMYLQMANAQLSQLSTFQFSVIPMIVFNYTGKRQAERHIWRFAGCNNISEKNFLQYYIAGKFISNSKLAFFEPPFGWVGNSVCFVSKLTMKLVLYFLSDNLTFR